MSDKLLMPWIVLVFPPCYSQTEMYTRKRIGISGLLIGFCFSLLLTLVQLSPHKAYATAPTDITGASLEAINASTLTLTIGGQGYDFKDGNPKDGTANFSGQVDGCDSTIKVSGTSQTDLANKKSTLTVPVAIKVNPSRAGCIDTKPSPVNMTIKSPANFYAFFSWTAADTITSAVDGKTFKKDASSGLMILDGVSNCADRVVLSGNGAGTLYTLTKAGIGSIDGSKFPDAKADGCNVSGINYQSICSQNDGDCTLISSKVKDAQKLATQKFNISGTPASPVDGGVGAVGADNNSCEAKNHTTVEWILCPLIRGLDDIIGSINGLIEDQLFFDTNGFGPDNQVKQAWSIIKNLSTVLLVIIMLVMVASEALGFGVFDAYTIRKVLPRLVIAVIVIQISWPLFVWTINLSNDAGQGIADILYAPFGGSSKMTLSGLVGDAGVISPTQFSLFTILTVGGGGAAAVLLNPFGVAAMAISAVAAVFIAYIVLIFRKVLIILCMILVPLALVAWILPGTQKYWKLWHETFSKLLLMFPLIVSLIAAGRIFAFVTITPSTIGSSSHMLSGNLAIAGWHAPSLVFAFGESLFDYFALLIGFFGPYFLLPKTFQWSGRALGSITGVVNNRGKGVFDRSKQFMQNRQKGLSDERTRRSAKRVAGDKASWWRGDQLKSGQWDPTYIGSGGARRRRAVDAYVGKGVASENEDVRAAGARLQLQFEQLDERIEGNDKDSLVRAISSGNEGYKYTTIDGKEHTLGKVTPESQRAALDQLARLGGQGNLRAIEQAHAIAMAPPEEGERVTPEKQRQLENMNKFLNAAAPQIFSKMPHLYKGVGGTIGGMRPEDFTSMDGISVETMVGELTKDMQDNAAGTEKHDKAAKNLATMTSVFHQASLDPTLKGRISPTSVRAMKGLVDDTNLTKINLGDKHVENPDVVPPIRGQVGLPYIGTRIENTTNFTAEPARQATRAALSAEDRQVWENNIRDLSARISDNGIIDETRPSAAAPPQVQQVDQNINIRQAPGGGVPTQGEVNIRNATPGGVILPTGTRSVDAEELRRAAERTRNNPPPAPPDNPTPPTPPSGTYR
jgi:hypothetical protein